MSRSQNTPDHPLAGIVSLALLWIAATGCGGSAGEPQTPPPTEVVVAAVTLEPIEDVLTAVGTVEANEQVELKAETPGTVASIHFTEGSHVNKNDLLFEFETAKERAQVAQAEAEEALARQNLERAAQLSGTRAISQQELDQLKSQVAAREAFRLVQSERLKDMTLTAPFAGVLGPRRVSVGQYVDQGTSLVTLVDASRVKVSFRIPERHLGRLRIGQDVRLHVAAYADTEFAGVIDLISPVVDEATRTVQVRALVPNANAQLRPGMFARVETLLSVKENVPVIPESALVASLDGFSVYLVENDAARLAPVEIGIRHRGKAEIRKGLSQGQLIVITGTQKLVDGTPVVAAKPESEPVTPSTTP